MTRRDRSEYDLDENGKTDYRTRRVVPIDQWEGTWMGPDPPRHDRSRDPAGRLAGEDLPVRPILQPGDPAGAGGPASPAPQAGVVGDRAGHVAPGLFLDDSKVPVQFPGRCLVVGPEIMSRLEG